jgi:hypothetical protein
MKDIY